MDNYNNANIQQNAQAGQKSKLVAFLLCWFLGAWGIHRFYVGKIGTGILYLLTCGCCGIGTIIDVFKFHKNTFTAKDDMPLKNDCPSWLTTVGVILIIAAIVIGLLIGLLAGGTIAAFFASML